MVTAKKESGIEVTTTELIEDLKHVDLNRSHGEFRRSLFVRTFKNLASAQKVEVCHLSALVLKNKFYSNERLEASIYLLATTIALERDWDAATSLLKSIVNEAKSGDFLKELALIFLEVADHEMSEKSAKLPLAQTILVLLTELGLQLAERSNSGALSSEESGRVVEYITTNLLARSNQNNTAMRISLVHYLSNCPMTSQTSLQLNRVISRFGQSLLDEMLKAFFEDKRKGNAAFFFLVEHLNSFFTASPALAEMSHNVLKNFMLRFPDEFPAFLASYCEFIPKEQGKLEQATKHLSLLLRSSVEVSQRQLSEAMGKVLLKHLKVYADVSQEFLLSHANEVVHLATAGGRYLQSPLLEDFLKQIKLLPKATGVAVSIGKVSVLAQKRKQRESVVKLAKVGDKPSPLDQMLQLAG
jgi:hypothetical protein